MKTKIMKTKIILSSLLFAAGFMLASCEKTYECHCVLKAGGETHEDVKAKKSDAETACQDLVKSNTTYSVCHLE